MSLLKRSENSDLALSRESVERKKTENLLDKKSAQVAKLESRLTEESNRRKNLAKDRIRQRKKIARLESDLAAERRKRPSPTASSKKLAKLTTSISSRTKKVAAANLASMAGEGIPFYGIAIIVAATAYELNVACENMKDLKELSLLYGTDQDVASDASEVCGHNIPTREELWELIKSSPSTVWEKTKDMIPSVGESPTFSGAWEIAVGFFDGIFDWN